MIAVIGDSLTVGSAPYLPAHYRVDARVGRTSAQGLYRLRHKRMANNAVLVWALGTNDGRVVRPPRRANVLVTLYGVPHARRFNIIVWASVPHRCVVRWGRWARRHRDHIGGDGVHGDAVAYRARARMTVRAVRGCA